MPIPTICAHCGTEYALADRLAGRKVRCKKCREVLAVPVPTAIRLAARAEHERAKARHGRRDDRFRKKSGGKRGLVIGLGVGCLVLLMGCSGGITFLYFSGRTAGLGSDLLVDTSPPWPEPFRMPAVQGNEAPETVVTLHIAGVVDRATEHEVGDTLGEIFEAEHLRASGHSELTMRKMTVVVSPVPDVRAFADKLTFGSVHGVNGRTITLVVRKADGPPDNADPLTWEIFNLKSRHRKRRAQAVCALAGHPPDGRRAEVARLLGPMLDDPDPGTRANACRALGSWGDAESVPGLLTALKDRDTRIAALDALGKLRDPRAVDPVSEHLADFFTSHAAMSALKAIGPASEKAMIRCLSSPDKRTREAACQVLKEVGGRESLAALQKATADSESAVAWHAKEAIDAISRRR